MNGLDKAKAMLTGLAEGTTKVPAAQIAKDALEQITAYEQETALAEALAERSAPHLRSVR